jgi:hypothetical protein
MTSNKLEKLLHLVDSVENNGLHHHVFAEYIKIVNAALLFT